MAKYTYNGKQILRSTIAGKDLIVEPGGEFELDKPNAYIDGLKQKGIVSDVVVKTPPPPKE